MLLDRLLVLSRLRFIKGHDQHSSRFPIVLAKANEIFRLYEFFAANELVVRVPCCLYCHTHEHTAPELIPVATGMIDGPVTTAQDLGVTWQKGPLSDGFPQSLPSLRTDLDMLARLIDLPGGVWHTFGQKFASFMESPVFKQQEALLEMLDRILDKLDSVAKEKHDGNADGQEGEQ
ncbi:hypothetical protein CDV36_009171 [Fusarium kuroshium]|uniref:Uncharacterized protein n=1 Tax=Fusarium kuroshium TaxID=2010991 RepID=A0A3M2S0X4_9HYPO|nr:hypothetical protein CDV36_009171 [Fusarium kuroshium]